MFRLLLLPLLLIGGAFSASASTPSGDWTPWSPVTGDWAEFRAFTSFRGGEPSPKKLAAKDPKSLKVECLIVGRILGDVPDEIKGTKAFKVLYRNYGFVDGFELGQDSATVYYRKDGASVPGVKIIRKATHFDVERASDPKSDVDITLTMPSFISMMGIDPVKQKVSGRQHRIPVEWRRKGDTVELRLIHYAPKTDPVHKDN